MSNLWLAGEQRSLEPLKVQGGGSSSVSAIMMLKTLVINSVSLFWQSVVYINNGALLISKPLCILVFLVSFHY